MEEEEEEEGGGGRGEDKEEEGEEDDNEYDNDEGLCPYFEKKMLTRTVFSFF